MRKRSWVRAYWENFLTGLGIILIFIVVGAYMLLAVALLLSGKWIFIGIGIILILAVICPIIGADDDEWR